MGLQAWPLSRLSSSGSFLLSLAPFCSSTPLPFSARSLVLPFFVPLASPCPLPTLEAGQEGLSQCWQESRLYQGAPLLSGTILLWDVLWLHFSSFSVSVLFSP